MRGAEEISLGEEGVKRSEKQSVTNQPKGLVQMDKLEFADQCKKPSTSGHRNQVALG